jgi:hypothetical protein
MSNLAAVANVSEGTFEQREMTAQELEQDAIHRAETKKQNDLEEQAEATKATEKTALLAKLGITAEEAALLLGGN